MATNRYTNITPSAYNPLTLQEIMIAPQMKRMQHNQADEALINLESQLAKVDPLDVHLNEATRLRSDINKQIAAQADALSREGFNTNTLSGVKRTNRQLQDLMAPTGRLGQINAAKPAYFAERKAYLENAEKNDISPEAAILNWEQYAKGKYTGYNPDGSIANIRSYGAPNKQNLQDDIKYYNSILGDTERGAAANGYNIVERPDGSLIFQDRSGNYTTKTNIPQLNDALEGINAKWLSPSGEGYRWAQHNRLDPNNIRNQINSAFRSMQQTSKVDTRKWNNQYVAPRADDGKDKNTGDIAAVTEPVQDITVNTDGFINSISAIGVPNNPSATEQAVHSGTGARFGIVPEPLKPGKTKTYADLSPEDRTRYLDTYNGLRDSGRIPANLGANSPQASKIIADYLSSHKNLAFNNKILKPDAVQNEIQASLGIVGKDANQRNTHIEQEINAGRIKLYDKATGKEVDLEDIDEPKFNYVGYMSADSMPTKYEKGNKASSVMPHIVQITDKDGKTVEVYGTRDATDMKKNSFKAAQAINEVSRRSKLAPDLPVSYTDPVLKSKGFSNVTTRYNSDTDTYDVIFKTNEKEPRTKTLTGITAEEYSNIYYNLYGK